MLVVLCFAFTTVTVFGSGFWYNCVMNTSTVYKALQQMRRLSRDNIPFSLSFLTYSQTTGVTKGVKVVGSAKLRVGLPGDHGIKSRSLVGYIDLDTNEDRWFYLPLLLTFNKIKLNA
jgi:hypothetical protein